MKFLFPAKILSLLLLIAFLPSYIFTVPMYNPYDPFVYYTVYGVNKFYKKIDKKFQASLNISPFYQSAAYARDKDGIRVPEGDMYGRWNMFGWFYGISYGQANASPSSNPFSLQRLVVATNNVDIPDSGTQTRYPKLSDAWRVLDNKSEGTAVTEPPYNAVDLGINFTDTSDPNFSLSGFNKYMPLIYTNYEKMGIRGQFNLDLNFGLGLNIQGGFIDYKQSPDIEDDLLFDKTQSPGSYIWNYFRKPEIFEKVCNELEIDISRHQETTLEDTHIQLYYVIPFKVMNDEGEHVVTLAPYFAVGAWLPTGKEKKQDKAFSLPTGNDGFWGITVDGQINFDLPETIQFGFGLGAAYFFDRNLDAYRIASNEFQQGMFPWKANIQRDPGLIWYFNASLKAVEFIDHFSAYIDFIYLKHNRDKIHLRESDSSRNDLFQPYAYLNEENSKWWFTMFQGGVDYKLTSGLQIGLGFQAHLNGRRVYRNTTILGTMSFVF